MALISSLTSLATAGYFTRPATTADNIRSIFADNGVTVAQGAFGTQLELKAKEANVDVCRGNTLWSGLANVDKKLRHFVSEIHRDYAQAGATMLLANTYINLQRYLDQGISRRHAVAAIKGAVKAAHLVAREITDRKVLVGASIAPISDFTKPETASADTALLLKQHTANAQIVAAAKPDYLQVECFSTLNEGEAMIRAAAATGLPVLVSFVPTVNAAGKQTLLDGTPLALAIEKVKEIGGNNLIGLGINCRTADVIDAVLPTLADHAGNRVVALFPNGVGEACNTGWKHGHHHGHSHDHGSAHVRNGFKWSEYLAAKGIATVYGGCCGSTPKDIADFSAARSAAATRINGHGLVLRRAAAG